MVDKVVAQKQARTGPGSYFLAALATTKLHSKDVHAHTANQYMYHANVCCSHIVITGVGYYLYNRRNVPNTTEPVAGTGMMESTAQCLKQER